MNLKPLICWPDKDMIISHMPKCFKPQYSRATCIIDCSEIFTQRPISFRARAQTYSNYKGHNTIKFLVAITPTGAISFISRCWGGRVSDKHLTANCGNHGDMVIADRGFDIADEIACVGATLKIPPFSFKSVIIDSIKLFDNSVSSDWDASSFFSIKSTIGFTADMVT